jgi:ribonuclease VapC
MIYADPSCILSVLLEESDAARFRERLAVAKRRVICMVGKIEIALGLGRAIQNHELASTLVDKFCESADVTVLPVEQDFYPHVMQAYWRYGKGTGHPAKLNLGDCFSYAFAKRLGIPLLFKGDDFSKTDIVSAL